MMAPGQKERFLFSRMVLVLPTDNQMRVLHSRINEGVSHGSGRAPSLGSSFAEEKSLRNQGAWPAE